MTIAYFITSHGFGHSTRALAVMQSILERDESIRFEIFTSTPRWLFEEGLGERMNYNEHLTDIGLIQKTALEEDIEETIKRVNAFYPVDVSAVNDYATSLKHKECELVVCDIAPIGILVADVLGIPSVLIENFTWDWVYKHYSRNLSSGAFPAKYLSALFDQATFHIQTEPVTVKKKVDLLASPVCRSFSTSRDSVRKDLGGRNEENLILITMGGGHSMGSYEYDLMESKTDCVFMIPCNGHALSRKQNILSVPYSFHISHPDLIAASDLVIGKIGYSTLSEIYHAGVPFGYIPRAQFPESDILEKFIAENMPGKRILEEDFNNGEWLNQLDELLSFKKIMRKEENGSSQIAQFILDKLSLCF